MKIFFDFFFFVCSRKGLATGIVIGGFGSGALFFAPAMNFLMSKFSVAPAFLGNGLDLDIGYILSSNIYPMT